MFGLPAEIHKGVRTAAGAAISWPFSCASGCAVLGKKQNLAEEKKLV